MTLRPATPHDQPAIWSLVQDCLAEFGFEPDSLTSESDLLDIEASYPGGLFTVADSDGRVLGTVGLVRVDEHVVKLRKMYVAKDARGHGLGRTLLEHALVQAKTSGFGLVRLETTHEMAVAHQLYESAGFRLVDRVPDSPRCRRVYEQPL